MRQVRNGVFETNSSSTHSMVIGTEKEFSDWESGKLYYYDGYGDPGFLTEAEVLKHLDITAEEFAASIKENQEFGQDYDIWTFQAYSDYKDEYCESIERTYTTPDGEKIKVMCHYGNDY